MVVDSSTKKCQVYKVDFHLYGFEKQIGTSYLLVVLA